MTHTAPSFAAFVSHAKADAKKANEIAAQLEKRGVKCWIAPRDVEPGRNFGDEIIRGIEASNAFILVLSSASNGSDFVARELATAVGKKKPVFPIRVEEVEPAPPLALFIAGTHWIDAFSGKLGSADAGRLAELIAGRREPSPAPKPMVQKQKSPWIWRTGAALAAAAALTVLVLGWPSNRPADPNAPSVDPVVIDPSTVPSDVPQVASPGEGVPGLDEPAFIAKVPGSSDPAASAETAIPSDEESHTIATVPKPDGFGDF